MAQRLYGPYSHHGRSEVRENDLPKGASSDTDEAFWAQLSREAPGVIEIVQNQRCEVHPVLVRVVQPRPGGQGQNCRVLLNCNSNQTNRSCSKESMRHP